MAVTGKEALTLKQLRNAFSGGKGGASFPITFSNMFGVTLYGIIDGEFQAIALTGGENQTFNIQACVPFILERHNSSIACSVSEKIKRISDYTIFVAYGSGSISELTPNAL